MNRVGAEIRGDMITLFQNAQHPVAQAGGLHGTRVVWSWLRHDWIPRRGGDRVIPFSPDTGLRLPVEWYPIQRDLAVDLRGHSRIRNQGNGCESI